MTGGFRLAGLIGYPLGHSLSPLLHALWLAEYDIRGVYVPLAASTRDFSAVVESARNTGFRGLNVTVPHKQSARALANTLDEAATVTGAANLLLFSDGKIDGRNTDVAGLSESLADEFGPEACRGKIAVLLGAGGAARAAVLALARLGVAKIRVLSRQESRAQNLAEELAPHLSAQLVQFAWAQWPEAARHAGVLVNATPGGMRGAPALDLPLEPLPIQAMVYDLVYNPLETALLKQARARGHMAANGLGMLVHQAVPAFGAFYGRMPENIRAARCELEKALSS